MEISNYLEISLNDLSANAKKCIDEVKVPVMGIVKCDGYGMGLYEAADAWLSSGAEMLGVSIPEEALKLREMGISSDILLLSPVYDSALAAQLIENNIILTVTSYKCAQNCSAAAFSLGLNARVHIKVDTGMGRYGISWRETDELAAVYSIPYISFEGIFSHFSTAFEKKYNFTKTQLERFLSAVDALKNRGISPGIRHIAASCAALRFPDTRLDMVRIGSALVGRLPCPVPIDLVPVGNFKAKVLDTKILFPGDTSGYGAVFKSKKKMSAVVVAAGTSDFFSVSKADDNFCFRGILRSVLSALKGRTNRPYATYGGKKLPLLGRAGSQFSLFDAEGIPISPGDFVTIPVCVLSPGRNRRYI